MRLDQEHKFIPSVLKKINLFIAYDDQDLELVVKSPTSTNARVDQDLELVVKSLTSTKARTAQEVVLLVVQNIIAPPATALLTFVDYAFIRSTKRNQGLYNAASVPVFAVRPKVFPIVFCVT